MILRNVSIKKYNTFRIDHRVDRFLIIKSEAELIQALRILPAPLENILILGGGSNLLFTSDFKEIIIHPEIEGIVTEKRGKDDVLVSCGAGVLWDDLVEWSVSSRLGGLENLSLIPGTVGAAPVQNIGAYGVEVQDSVEQVRAVSLSDGSVRNFNNNECLFSYRDSVFKQSLKGKYLITRVTFRLNLNPVLKTGYGSLQEEVQKSGEPTIKSVRDAVIRIRRSKLPDPVVIGNAGSFFKNPEVSREKADLLKISFPGLPVYETPSGRVKLAAGWMIEKCGWKGKRAGDAGVHEKQALVLVNYGKASGKEILELSEKISHSVADKFGVNLEREVEVVGAI
jgi:UDP-N-acetylmuramate dehydrogenase